MIILTNKSLIKLPFIEKESTIINYANENYCLCQIKENTLIDSLKYENNYLNVIKSNINKYDIMSELDILYKLNIIDFWWGLSDGYINLDNWDLNNKYKGGIIEGIYYCLNLSKPQNIALSIYEISKKENNNPFDIWNKYML